MGYVLKEIAISMDGSENEVQNLNDIWRDVESGKIPLLFDSDGEFMDGLSPISLFTNYAANQKGIYDLKIITVKSDFFAQMEQRIIEGKYRKYDCDDANMQNAINRAWSQVQEDEKNGVIVRAYTKDYESTVPKEYTKDGKAHCYLYISL
ncbi:MAG: AraC family transcriptional regulator [Clostridia bacterium]|nr:AraC family transcriptional regulator [Clostridia bacterium]